jgi:hypothetical protein
VLGVAAAVDEGEHAERERDRGTQTRSQRREGDDGGDGGGKRDRGGERVLSERDAGPRQQEGIVERMRQREHAGDAEDERLGGARAKPAREVGKRVHGHKRQPAGRVGRRPSRRQASPMGVGAEPEGSAGRSPLPKLRRAPVAGGPPVRRRCAAAVAPGAPLLGGGLPALGGLALEAPLDVGGLLCPLGRRLRARPGVSAWRAL